MLSLFDDGSSVTTDSSGAVVSATDNSGINVPVAAPDSGIGQQFANLVTYGVASLIGNRLPPAAAPRTGAPQPASSSLASLSPTVKLVGLALIGFLLYKKFA